MEHSDFSSDISSDDIISDDEHEEYDDFRHEHEQTSKYNNLEVVAFKYGMH